MASEPGRWGEEFRVIALVVLLLGIAGGFAKCVIDVLESAP